MDPEARLLRSFLAVAEQLNFTRAAEALGIAQPALSAQIRQLEAQLGVQLLERTTRSVRLTDAGRVLQERGPAALAGLAAAWESARSAGRGELGRLRLAYSASAGYDTAPQLVQAVRERHPELDVHAEVRPSAEIPRGLLEGSVDAGLARMPAPVAGVRSRTVRLDRQGALVAAGHPLAALPAVAVAALAEHPILMHPRADNPAHFDFVTALFREAGREPQLVERPVAFDPTQRLIREGRVAGLVGESSAEGLAAELRWIPLTPAVHVEVALLVREADLPPAADRFERVAVAHAAAAGWLRGA